MVADTARKGYYQFNSLLQVDELFKCCLCGYHPLILTFDVIRKLAFDMPAIDIKDKVVNDIVI